MPVSNRARDVLYRLVACNSDIGIALRDMVKLSKPSESVTVTILRPAGRYHFHCYSPLERPTGVPQFADDFENTVVR
jgi:hypothetical protein